MAARATLPGIAKNLKHFSHLCGPLLGAGGVKCEQLEQLLGSQQSKPLTHWRVQVKAKDSLHFGFVWGSCKFCPGSGSKLVVRIKNIGKVSNAC